MIIILASCGESEIQSIPTTNANHENTSAGARAVTEATSNTIGTFEIHYLLGETAPTTVVVPINKIAKFDISSVINNIPGNQATKVETLVAVHVLNTPQFGLVDVARTSRLLVSDLVRGVNEPQNLGLTFIDSDGDGIDNITELQNGTNPFNSGLSNLDPPNLDILENKESIILQNDSQISINAANVVTIVPGDLPLNDTIQPLGQNDFLLTGLIPSAFYRLVLSGSTRSGPDLGAYENATYDRDARVCGSFWSEGGFELPNPFPPPPKLVLPAGAACKGVSNAQGELHIRTTGLRLSNTASYNLNVEFVSMPPPLPTVIKYITLDSLPIRGTVDRGTPVGYVLSGISSTEKYRVVLHEMSVTPSYVEMDVFRNPQFTIPVCNSTGYLGNSCSGRTPKGGNLYIRINANRGIASTNSFTLDLGIGNVPVPPPIKVLSENLPKIINAPTNSIETYTISGLIPGARYVVSTTDITASGIDLYFFHNRQFNSPASGPPSSPPASNLGEVYFRIVVASGGTFSLNIEMIPGSAPKVRSITPIDGAVNVDPGSSIDIEISIFWIWPSSLSNITVSLAQTPFTEFSGNWTSKSISNIASMVTATTFQPPLPDQGEEIRIVVPRTVTNSVGTPLLASFTSYFRMIDTTLTSNPQPGTSTPASNLWSQSFSNNSDGFWGLPASHFSVNNGKLVITTQDANWDWPGAWGKRVYSFNDEMIFRSQVITGAKTEGRYLLVGAESDTGQGPYRRHAAFFDENKIYASYYDNGWQMKYLGLVQNNTIYTVEVENNSSGTQLYIYRTKDQTRVDGVKDSRSLNDWEDIETFIEALSYPGAVNTKMYIDEISEWLK